MALINCSECGKEISDKADKCPHCGAPILSTADKIQMTGEAISGCGTALSGIATLIFIIGGCILLAMCSHIN